jgi:hypothetical protein
MASSKRGPAIGAIVVGLAFVLIGLARPAFLWDMGKVAQGRAAIGDTGVTVFFVAIGVALAAAGLYLSRKA